MTWMSSTFGAYIYANLREYACRPSCLCLNPPPAAGSVKLHERHTTAKPSHKLPHLQQQALLHVQVAINFRSDAGSQYSIAVGLLGELERCAALYFDLIVGFFGLFHVGGFNVPGAV